MSEISKPQQNALSFFAQGGCVEFCTSVGRCLGNMAFYPQPIVRINKAVIDTLFAKGLLKSYDVHIFGMRWSRLVLSDKGKVNVSLLEIEQ